MIKITNMEDRTALRIALSITRTKRVVVTPGSIRAACRGANVEVTWEHNIPPGQYVCKDFFLTPCDLGEHVVDVVLDPGATYIGQVPSAPAWQMQMEIAELSGHILSMRYLKALSIVYKGRPVTIFSNEKNIFLTLENIVLTIALYVQSTKVLVSGLPVTQHQALRKMANDQGTSVNKIILAAIKESINKP